MTYKIVTQESRTITAREIVTGIESGNNDLYSYYVFLGKHTQYGETSDVVTAPLDDDNYNRQVYNDMMFGKKVTPSDVKLMVKRNTYVANTVYDMYDDTDGDLYSKDFFVVVPRGTSHDVFKCLSNSDGLPSTVPPDKLDITNFDEIYRTSDGYVWKYMYTIQYADMQKFATDTLIPVVANAEVSSSATAGTIDVVKVISPGSRYDNNLYGTLANNDLNINQNKKRIDVSGNNQASTIEDFYYGCIFKIVSGGGVGQYSKIVSYDMVGNRRVITLADELDVDGTSEYEITPEVEITGDYTQTINAVARAIINSTANSVDYVEILNRGADYKLASAFVYASNVVPYVTNAAVRAIIGPYGGHGYDAAVELGASKACFSVTFNETADSLPSVNDFRQIGVISNPAFSNVIVNFSSKDATTFVTGERAYQIHPVRLFAANVTINTSANVISSSVPAFENLESNTILYIVGNTSKQLATITGITNATHLVIDTAGNFACNDCELYLANVSVNATVTSDLFGAMSVSGLTRPYESGEEVVGYDSGAYGIVDSMELANTATNLSTFNQMWKYYVTTTDTFEEDEVVFQANSAANSHGNLFGIVEAGASKIMYLTNQYGYINTGDNVVGANSGDSAYVASSYEPDLTYTSGRIIYLENIEKVTRATGQKETFKIIFSY